MLADTLILHYHDVVIRQYDLDTLAPGQWLNDTMIEFHMEFLERNYVPKDVKYLLLRPGMAHLITYIEGDVMQLEPVLPANMDQYQIIFIPVNDGVPQKAYSGSHWSLMVYVRAVNSFYYFDTLGSTNMNQGKIIYKRLEALLKLEHPAQFIPSSTPQQENGTDCGVLVIALIDYILYELLKNHNSEDQDESTKYSQIMKIKPECLSTANQVRHNLIDVINRLQQRSSTSSSNKS